MGNESSQNITSLLPSALPQAQIISLVELPHLGPLTLIHFNNQTYFQKTLTFPDVVSVQEKLRQLKPRTKLTGSPYLLNLYQINRRQSRDMCAINYNLQLYLEKYETTLDDIVKQRYLERKNFQEKQLISIMMKIVESILYLQDNGFRNILLDTQAIIVINDQIKVLDQHIAYSKKYLQLVEAKQKQLTSKEWDLRSKSLYLAPEMLKELSNGNYDPCLSTKSDIFSLGMIVIQMITLQSMNSYYNYPTSQLDYQSLIHRLSKINSSLQLKTLLAEMLEIDPQQRIGLVTLKQKLQKISNNNEPVVKRSKSSKMLQEIMSQSRRSGSTAKQSTSRLESNTSLSKHNSSQRKFTPRIQVRSSNKKSTQYIKHQTQPSQKQKDQVKKDKIDIFEQQHTQSNILKNLVKTKLAKQKNKQNKQISYFQYKNKNGKRQTKRFYQQQLTQQILNTNISNNVDSRRQSLINDPLGKLTEHNKMKNLLRVEQLDTNPGSSIKKTSRFGMLQSKQQSLQPSKKRSQIYIRQQNSQSSINQSKQQVLNKVMTFNKQFTSVQSYSLNKQDNYIYSPMSNYKNDHQYADYKQQHQNFNKIQQKQLILKNIPVVVSVQKQTPTNLKPPSHFGNLQRHLDLSQLAQSIQQSPKSKYSFNNSSKVIQINKYNPVNSNYNSIESKQQQFNGQSSKNRYKKPQLTLAVGQEQQNIFESSAVNSKIQYQSVFHKPQTYQQFSLSSIVPTPYDKLEHLSMKAIQMQFKIPQERYGRLTLSNGQVYQGNMFDNIPNGNGCLFVQGKIKYDGSFKDGMYNGYGNLFNLNFQPKQFDYRHIDISLNYWTKYEGEFYNGLQQGFGSLYLPDGVKFTGNFQMGHIQGYGCVYLHNGQIMTGRWSNNYLQKR